MRVAARGKRKRILLEPGEYYVTREDMVISTLLGSCVAVCLYDPSAMVMGMNHFLLTEIGRTRRAACFEAGGKMADCAMQALWAGMLAKGASHENIRAKAFGGASMFQPFAQCRGDFCISRQNIEFAKRFLAGSGIPLVSQDLGGDVGRMIHFSFGDFTVYVRKTKKTVNPKLRDRDGVLFKQIERVAGR